MFSKRGPIRRRSLHLLRMALPIIISFVIYGCSAAKVREALLLDVSDLVIPAGESRTLHFVAPDPLPARPALWLAPRIVFVMEERVVPALSVRLNGVWLDRERFQPLDAKCRFPCDAIWPTRTAPICAQVGAAPRWLVRYDSNFTMGETDAVSWRRQYVTEGLPPSYVLDLTGVLHPGENTLEVFNTLSAKPGPRPTDLTFDEHPPLPYFALHAQFVRVGMVRDGDIQAYTLAHTKPIDPCLRTFDVRTREGFSAMQHYYTEAAAQPGISAALRASLRLAEANFEAWKGNYSASVALLDTLQRDDPERKHLAESLFLSGLALTRMGESEAAKRWGELKTRFPSSSWTGLAERETEVASHHHSTVEVGRLVLEAVRADQPVTMDGKLDDPVWARASVAANFHLHPGGDDLPSVRTEARVAYDDKYLYLGVVCWEPFMDEIRNANLDRDSEVWNDDNVEWFFDPHRTYVRVFEFEIGANGGIVDCLNIWQVAYMDFDPPRVDKIERYPDRWSVETALTWDSLGSKPPAPGEVWLCNVVRTRPASEHRTGEAMAIGPSCGRFGAPESSTQLFFK